MNHSELMQLLCPQFGFIDGVGAPEMVLIFVIILVLFGGQKLPEFARGLGKTLREFKKAASGVEEEFKRALEEDERKHAVQSLPEPTTPSSTTPTNDPAGPGGSPEAGHDPHHDYYDHDHSYGTEGVEKNAATADATSPAPAATPEAPTAETAPAPGPTPNAPTSSGTPPTEPPAPPSAAAGTLPKTP
ncbi:MAG: twin-arginine translocase TatA/TatE family subunit [Verrucomicrobiota bacterium]|jgi:sec-independent protein translocase protein TatA